MPDQLKAVRPPPRNVNARRADTSAPLAAPPTTGEMLRAIGITPLEAQTIGAVPLATTPDPPAADDLAPQQTTLIISTTILHRGRLITIACEGRTLDAFCDLLDKRFGVAS